MTWRPWHLTGISRIPTWITTWTPAQKRFWISAIVGFSLLCSGLGLFSPFQPHASAQSSRASVDSYCRQSPAEVARKAQLRQLASRSDRDWAAYTQILGEHRERLRQCRQVRWPRVQAIWVRLYPCDQQPGVMDEVFDRVVNLGYNRVFLEVFRDTGTILPAAASSQWAATTEVDLFRMGLNAAKQRGLSAYAWMFSLNFGNSYQRPERQDLLAKNGQGQTSIQDETQNLDTIDVSDIITNSEVFVDPFSAIARQDYAQLVNQVLLRRPDGVLFDYIRYPRGAGRSTISQNVRDLWIHGQASRQQFQQLGTNAAGQELLNRYLTQGTLTAADIQALDQQFGGSQPTWRQPGRGSSTATPPPPPDLSAFIVSDVQAELKRELTPTPPPPRPSVAARLSQWQPQLWELAVSFARFAVVDYLRTISQPVQAKGIPTGAVFFPDANRAIQSGFDARLQPWDQFTDQNEWHPMAYALCEDASCVVREVERVLNAAPPGVFVCPAIAGLWGTPLRQRPPLEVQMSQLQQQFPQLPCVSHFSLSWIDGPFAQERRSCQVSS